MTATPTAVASVVRQSAHRSHAVARRPRSGAGPLPTRPARHHVVRRDRPTVGAGLRRAEIARRASTRAAVRRRRRFVAAACALGVVVAAGHAGTALGGSSLATPERSPQVVTYVVEPGDSLWDIAEELAPERDRREVVDALADALGSADLVPGQTVTWLVDS